MCDIRRFYGLRELHEAEFHKESSHGRGATKLSELLTLGAQCLIRNVTPKKFLRATRPTFLCVSPETIIPGVPHVRSSTTQKQLSQKVQPLQWDASKLGIHGSGRVWVNAWDVFRRTPYRRGRCRRVAVDFVVCLGAADSFVFFH